MPEFELDKGNADCSEAFDKLDDFTQGYIEGMFFTIDEELKDCNLSTLSLQAWVQALQDCADFRVAYRDELEETIERYPHYSMNRAGTDYWLTRNRHGAGFWDRGLEQLGTELTAAAHADGSLDLYRSDDDTGDGLLYFQ